MSTEKSQSQLYYHIKLNYEFNIIFCYRSIPGNIILLVLFFSDGFRAELISLVCSSKDPNAQ